MRAVIQRVARASVKVNGRITGSIGHGLLVFLGVTHEDTPERCALLARKTAGLRIFCDEAGKMNLSVSDIGGSVLVVSQFTLYADCRHGRRPSFTGAALPSQADELYNQYIKLLRENGIENIQTGIFGADMAVSLLNDGPVTIVLDTDDLK